MDKIPKIFKPILFVTCMVVALSFCLVKGAIAQEAEYVGTETCLACHEDQADKIQFTSHYKSLFEEEETLGGGCESCHGAGSTHADSTLKTDIIRNSPETCFKCHMGKKAEFQFQHHHPVMEGKMGCVDCHDLHGNEAESVSSVTSLQGNDVTCFKCHKEMKGPFVYEHDPMREGCDTCHNPHGSVYDKMLIADQTNLCLRCHWESGFNTSAGTIGFVDHNYYIGRGEECIDHHRAPHGSNIWKTLNR